MDIEVKHGSTDVTNHLIEYTRNIQICSGIGSLSITFSKNIPVTLDTWDKITITEDSIKRGEFYIASVSEDASTGNFVVDCQDNSKRLTDYFISDSYVIDYYSTTGYWIEFFLNEVGITYQNNGGVGVPISNNTTLGLQMAYDQVVTLLQYSGWYMYFDEDGVCIIGDLDINSSTPTRIDDDIILSLSTSKSDKMLRNRAVVWGNFSNIDNAQVFADVTVRTPWNYDANDNRAILLANPNLRSAYDANMLANKMIDEFARITFEITVEVAGSLNVNLGNMVFLRSMAYRGLAKITTISVSCSNSGLITTLILNQRCPRLFSFWGEVLDYVYIGTSGAGVWRKPLDGSTWADYSIGLPSGCIVTDLYINNGIFGLTNSSGILYYKDLYSSWTPYYPSGLVGHDLVVYSGGYAEKVTMNHITNNIIAGYVVSSGTDKSWAVEISPTGAFVRSDQVYQGNYNYTVSLVDIDTNDVNNIIVAQQAGGRIPVVMYGMRSNSPPYSQKDSYVILPESLNLHVEGGVDYTLSTTSYYNQIVVPLVQTFDTSRVYSYHIKTLSGYLTAYRVKYNLTWSGSSWSITKIEDSIPLHFRSFSNRSTYGRFLYKDPDDDDILYATVVDRGPSGSTTRFYHYVINFNTGTFTFDYSVTFNEGTAGDFFGLTYSPVQIDNLIWNVYYNASGTQLDIRWWSYDQVTNTIVTGHIWKIFDDLVASGYTFKLFTEDGGFGLTGECFSIRQDNSGFIWIAPYKTVITSLGDRVVQTGFLYGNEELIYKENVWARLSTDTRSWGCSEMNYGISGNIGDKTGVISAYNTYISNFDTGVREEGLIAKAYMNDDLVIHWRRADGYFSSDADYNTWRLGDFMLHKVGTSSDYLGIFAVSSKSIQTPIFLQMDLSGAFGKVRVIDLPSFDLRMLLDYSASNMEVLPRSTYNDDFREILYLSVLPAGFLAHVLATVDLSTGNILHIYDDISGGASDSFVFGASYAVTFVWPNDGYWYTSAGGTTVIKQTSGIFEDILISPYSNYRVEIAKSNPTEIYPITISGTTYPVYQSFTNLSGSFTQINVGVPIYDGRVFDFLAPSGVYLASGFLTNMLDLRYFGYPTGNSLLAFPVTTISGVITIATISGVNHLETSNHTSVPYFFLSTSGISQSGRFFQRNPTASYFTSYSVGLPSSEITVIRMDDIL